METQTYIPTLDEAYEAAYQNYDAALSNAKRIASSNQEFLQPGDYAEMWEEAIGEAHAEWPHLTDDEWRRITRQVEKRMREEEDF